MATATSIEWTRGDDGTAGCTWNPVAGCSIVSAGCKNCYAMRMAARLESMGQQKYQGLTKKVNGHHVWTGKINLDEEALLQPLSWKKPRRVFVNSMSDLFHEDVPFEFVDKVFAVVALCPQHTFQVLTKRPERMHEYLESRRPRGLATANPRSIRTFPPQLIEIINEPREELRGSNWCTVYGKSERLRWPLPNCWLGTSVEDQARADERIPHLLKCPAAIRFLSCELLLGPIDLDGIPITVSPGFFGSPLRWHHRGRCHEEEGIEYPTISWVIVGGESGPGARPMHPDWARSIRDQCTAAGVKFFFKQWGEYFPVMESDGVIVSSGKSSITLFANGQTKFTDEQKALKNPARDHGAGRCALMERIGKKAAGRLLDDREWNEFPQTQEVTSDALHL